MLTIIIIIIVVLIIFILLNMIIKNNENFCYGNVYCDGNNDNALCINQTCKSCGLQSKCDTTKSYQSQCGSNRCIDGCCDNM